MLYFLFWVEYQTGKDAFLYVYHELGERYNYEYMCIKVWYIYLGFKVFSFTYNINGLHK